MWCVMTARRKLIRSALGLILLFLVSALVTTPASAAPARLVIADPSPGSVAVSSPDLITAYASARHIPVTDVAGVRAGTVRTAYDASTKTSWATASFLPSAQ